MVLYLLILSDMRLQTGDRTRLPNLTGFPYLGVRLYILAILGLEGSVKGRVGMLQEESQWDYNVLYPQKQ